MKLILITYACWVLILELSGWYYSTRLMDKFPIEQFLNFNLVNITFALFLFYYIYSIDHDWKKYRNRLTLGFFIALVFTILSGFLLKY